MAQPKLRWAVGLVIVAFLVGCGGYVVPQPITPQPPLGAHIATVVPTAPATRSVAVDSLPLANPPEFVFPRPVQRQVMPLPRQPQLQVLTNALTAPVLVTHAPGDLLARLFVLEQAGPIRVWQNGQLLPTPFLDLTALVESAANEQGLLGLAFAPNFAESRWFWVYYTTKDQSAVLVRYRAEPGLQTADPASAALVLRISDRVHTNHNGGMLAFGSDGYLYLALGDGGGAGDPEQNAQNPKQWLGKLLRLAVSTTTDAPAAYQIPPTNPFADGQQGAPEVWMLGLRNPWRFSFDSVSGDLYVADVGQQQLEELNYWPVGALGGANFGWPVWEGSQCYQAQDCVTAQFSRPVLEYQHTDGNCAIVGGVVYRGSALPVLAGHYIFGDYCSGQIWQTSAGVAWQRQLLVDSDYGLASFGTAADGEVYLVNRERGELLLLGSK